jgi:hypothetical protein
MRTRDVSVAPEVPVMNVNRTFWVVLIRRGVCTAMVAYPAGMSVDV